MPHKPRLQFTDEEMQGAPPRLKHRPEQSDKAEKAPANSLQGKPAAKPLSEKPSPDQPCAAPGKIPAAQLHFNGTQPKPASKFIHTLAQAPTCSADVALRSALHHQIDEGGGEENAGVQGADAAVTASETGVRALQAGSHRQKPGQQHQILRAQRTLDKAEINSLFEKSLAETPEPGSNPVSRRQQKRRIKRQYAAAKRAALRGKPIQAAQTTLRGTGNIANKGAAFVRSHKGGMAAVVVAFLAAAMIVNLFFAGTVLVQGAVGGMAGASYPAHVDEMLAAENVYLNLERALQEELDNYAARHPGCDEYIIEQDELGHDPYVLMALLSACLQREWTLAEAQPLMEQWFARQYSLTETVTSEQRTRTETTFGPDGREIIDEVEYEYRICTVTLSNFILARLAPYVLDENGLSIYAAYMASYGNNPELFTGAVLRPDPEWYTVPPEALADEQFATMLTEAEKYIGYPYVWGGSSPATSFDCSGFVCWVINHSGGAVGRTTAQGLFDMSTPVAAGTAQPGDLVFFTGTYASAGPVSHVGLYVGNGIMLHCGDPISYANLNTAYWQEHLYAFGRLPN